MSFIIALHFRVLVDFVATNFMTVGEFSDSQIVFATFYKNLIENNCELDTVDESKADHG